MNINILDWNSLNVKEEAFLWKTTLNFGNPPENDTTWQTHLLWAWPIINNIPWKYIFIKFFKIQNLLSTYFWIYSYVFTFNQFPLKSKQVLSLIIVLYPHLMILNMSYYCQLLHYYGIRVVQRKVSTFPSLKIYYFCKT